jgi:tripartite-type tricarboxylate transporter receptor subunit TctC
MKYIVRICFAAALACAAAVAQAEYPDRTVTILLPSPPGGSADATARPVAKALTEALKQPFVVMNRAGAGGAIAYAQAANAKPDGHTLLLAVSTISVLPEAEKLEKRRPSYQLEQFAPLALLTAEPLVLMVRADSPWKSVDDLVKAARSAPGDVKYSSSGKFGPIHFPMEMFSRAAGIKLMHVPYSGGAPAATALLGKQVDVSAAGPAAAAAMSSDGRVRILAQWGGKRIEQMPEVPTLKELGYNAEYYLWSGLFTPAGTPPDVIAKLRATLRGMSTSPGFLTDMKNSRIPVTYLDAPEFETYWQRDSAALIKLTREIGAVE